MVTCGTDRGVTGWDLDTLTSNKMTTTSFHVSAVLSSTVQCSAVQYPILECSTVQCSAVQCSAVQSVGPHLPEMPQPDHCFPAESALALVHAPPQIPALKRASGTANGVASTQVGRRLLAACGDKRTDLASCELTLSPFRPLVIMAPPQGASGTVNDVAFTQDGRRLLAACGDKRILSWNFQSGQPGHTLTGHAGGVLSVACSMLDASVAVSVGEDRCVKVGGSMRHGGGHTRPVGSNPT